MINSFSALRKYDLEIRFHQCDPYQTSAFCGHVFTKKFLLKKITLGHMTENKKQMWLPNAHICYLILNAAGPCVAVLLHGAATSSAISPQMHQQNPVDAPPESVVPPESGVHPQNPVCTCSVLIEPWSRSANESCAAFSSASRIFPSFSTIRLCSSIMNVKLKLTGLAMTIECGAVLTGVYAFIPGS